MIDFIQLCESVLADTELLEEALNINALIPIAERAKTLRQEHQRAVADDNYGKAEKIKDELLAERDKAIKVFEDRNLTDVNVPENLSEEQVDRFIKLYVFGNRKEIQPDGRYGKFDPIPRLAGLIHLSMDIIKRVAKANEEIKTE